MRLEKATFNTDTEEPTDVKKGGSVTTAEPVQETGLSVPVLIVIIVLASLLLIPISIWLTINIIVKLCPNSKCGQRLNEWKANRALTDEQKQLQAF